MEKKEKIMQGIENALKEIANPEPIFSKEQYEEFKKAGLTQEEVEKLENAEAYAQIIDILPNDGAGVDKILEAFASLSNDSTKTNVENLLAIAQKDPNLLVQLLAVTAIAENENSEK